MSVLYAFGKNVAFVIYIWTIYKDEDHGTILAVLQACFPVVHFPIVCMIPLVIFKTKINI